jgi:hypothetical protein
MQVFSTPGVESSDMTLKMSPCNRSTHQKQGTSPGLACHMHPSSTVCSDCSSAIAHPVLIGAQLGFRFFQLSLPSVTVPHDLCPGWGGPLYSLF